MRIPSPPPRPRIAIVERAAPPRRTDIVEPRSPSPSPRRPSRQACSQNAASRRERGARPCAHLLRFDLETRFPWSPRPSEWARTPARSIGAAISATNPHAAATAPASASANPLSLRDGGSASARCRVHPAGRRAGRASRPRHRCVTSAARPRAARATMPGQQDCLAPAASCRPRSDLRSTSPGRSTPAAWSACRSYRVAPRACATSPRQHLPGPLGTLHRSCVRSPAV